MSRDEEPGESAVDATPAPGPAIGFGAGTEPSASIDGTSVEGRFRVAGAVILNQRAETLVTGAKGVLDVSDPGPAETYWLAAERMRVTLRLFAPYLPALETRSSRKEVGRIAKAVRKRRDADAVITLCESVLDEMPPGPADGLKRAVESLKRHQSLRNRELARQIHGRRLQSLRVRIEDLADRSTVQVTGERGSFPFDLEQLPDVALKLLLRRLGRLRGLAPSALEPDSHRDQHRMRVAAERLRYSLELTAAALGSQAQTARRAARALQEVLGEIRDSDLVPRTIRDAIAVLETEDVAAITERGRGSRDLDPVLVLAAPNRAGYQGCELALIHATARRQLLFERFRRLWLEQSRQGVWVGLDTGIRSKLRR